MIFCNFLDFFAIFFEFSFPGRVGTEFGTNFVFFSFSAYLIPVWVEIIMEWCFSIFWICCYLFLEFSYPCQVGMKFRTNFFFLFLGLSNPGFDGNNAEKLFFDFFFKFFLPFFLEFSLPGRVGTKFGSKFFFMLSRPTSSWIG